MGGPVRACRFRGSRYLHIAHVHHNRCLHRDLLRSQPHGTADGNHPLHPEFLFGGANQMRGAALSGNTVVFLGGTIFDPVSGFSAIYAGSPSCINGPLGATVPPLPGGCIELATAATVLPGDPVTPTHTRFSANTLQADGSVVAFYADEPGSPSFAGIYTVPVGGGAIQKIFDTTTVLPGLATFNKDTIGGFSPDGGNVLFRVKDTAGKTGIYLWSARNITRLAGTGDLIFGHPVADIADPASSSLSGNTAVFSIGFTDGTRPGIYTLTICSGNNALICAGQAAGTIVTFAGNGLQSFSGDGGPAPSASIAKAVAVVADYSGNVFIADQLNNRIRKVDTTGKITTVAGTGAANFSGDGGPATAATLNAPTGLAVDPAGNLLIADVGNQRIRKIDAGGTISTIAGTGTAGFSGDGGPAAQAAVNNAVRISADIAGNILAADQTNHRVRKIDASGKITTIAGTGAAGFSGDGGPATAAQLNNPTALASDQAGNLYISDLLNHRVRRIDKAGNISTIAGNGTAGFSGDGGPALTASLNFPGGLAVDVAGNLLLADSGNQRIRQVSTAGVISTIAGTGVADFLGDGGPAVAAPLNGAFGLALDTQGNLYIADANSSRIRQVSGRPGAPTFSAAGVNSAASYAPGLTPGSLAVLFGSRLSTVQGVQVATTPTWPTQLAGTSVTVGGTPAPVYAVANVNGTEQINFQIPFEVAGLPYASVVVSNNGNSTQGVPAPVLTALPAIFLLDGVNGVIVHGLTGAVVSAANPAAKGEVVVVYATGLGPVNPSPGTGNPASVTTLSPTVSPVTATIGGVTANVAFGRLTPSLIGVYQVNLTVPAVAPTGSDDLILAASGANSRGAKIAVK
jgi:uncharacterized protein (TIGR03437 family)